VNSTWLRANPSVKDFLMSLKDGLEKMLDIERAKLEEYTQAKNRIGR
jgi:hypothetical protein